MVKNYELKVLDWPAPTDKLSLREYAKKFLPQIDQTQNVNLLGVSFGGMLCIELASLLKAKKIILVSSCRDSSEFPTIFKFLRKIPLYKFFTEKSLRNNARKYYAHLGISPGNKESFIAMINSMQQNYFRFCLGYIFNWQGSPKKIEVLQIHGTRDKVIPHNGIKNFIAVENGSHAMVLDKADEINKILNRELNGL